MNLSPRFAQMLCSRLCHDLITPVGAIVSGFEVMEDCDEADRQQLATLTRQSALSASRRLSFYRAAFGAWSHRKFESIKALRSVLEDFLSPHRVDLVWEMSDEFQQDQEFQTHFLTWSQLILNAVLLGMDALPYGGKLTIRLQKEGSYRLNMIFEGKTVPLRREVKEALSAPLQDADITPQNVQATLTHMLCEVLDSEMTIDQPNPTWLEIRLAPREASAQTGTLF